MADKVPQRDFGNRVGNKSLAPQLPIVGLGCSSFSTFFWTPEESSNEQNAEFEPSALNKHNPRVQEWIKTIHAAIIDYGITLLDTAPWYGHGTSEIVVGWAMEGLQFPRDNLTINTKVGRYEANPTEQFDFSRETTISSVQRSLERMKCRYIDVLQLHDPEFAPSLEQLMTETIPALLQCKSNGWCKALGMTGYPLEVQYQLFQRTLQDFDGIRVWDQALTYGHFNLHNSSLVNRQIGLYGSFVEYTEKALRVGVLAAAPLSMGLLTNSAPPDWHPASQVLVRSCRDAASMCRDLNVDISELALLYALSNPQIPCTILGCKNTEEVKYAARIANRFRDIDVSMPQYDILEKMCNENEFKALLRLMDKNDGPFAAIWSSGDYKWDGTKIVCQFWENIDKKKVPDWQIKST